MAMLLHRHFSIQKPEIFTSELLKLHDVSFRAVRRSSKADGSLAVNNAFFLSQKHFRVSIERDERAVGTLVGKDKFAAFTPLDKYVMTRCPAIANDDIAIRIAPHADDVRSLIEDDQLFAVPQAQS